MRESIFDIVSENIDISGDAERIIKMATEEETLVIKGSYTLFNFVGTYCFHTWKYRGHTTDISDYLNVLDFDYLEANATLHTLNEEDFFILIELVYNFWQLAENRLHSHPEDENINYCGNFYHLKNVMDDILDNYNHIAHINEDHTQVLVIENKPEVTAVSEMLPSLSLDLIKYNHRTLKGDLKSKKSILISLARELEPKRDSLNKLNSQLTKDIFCMLNNLDIRHNNTSNENPKTYHNYVANMSRDCLEKWYDELYQMLLLAFLLLENIPRTEHVKELNTKIKECSN